jgi:hypothetical protein
MEMNFYELFKEIRLGDEHIKLFFIPNLVIKKIYFKRFKPVYTSFSNKENCTIYQRTYL